MGVLERLYLMQNRIGHFLLTLDVKVRIYVPFGGVGLTEVGSEDF